jgi:hypothetical protein
MSARLWWARLNSASPRYRDWHSILDGDEVPLLDPAEHSAQLGKETVNVYLVNVAALSAVQRIRLLDEIARRFEAHQAEVLAEIQNNGRFPIRAADVTVAFDLRCFV